MALIPSYVEQDRSSDHTSFYFCLAKRKLVCNPIQKVAIRGWQGGCAKVLRCQWCSSLAVKVKWQVTMSDCTLDQNGLFISPDYCVLWEKFAARAPLIFYHDNFYDDNRLVWHTNEGREVKAQGVQPFASKHDGFDPLGFLFFLNYYYCSIPPGVQTKNNGTSQVEK